MGSTLGLMHYLRKKGHNAQVVTPNDFGDFLNFLPGIETCVDFEESRELALEILEAADLIFCLDFNALSRINELGDFVGKSEVPKVMIDHHLHPHDFAEYALHDSEAAATCELVARMISMFGDDEWLDSAISTCLYTGIMTDTGSFRFSATTPEVHRTIATLMEHGAPHVQIHENINDSWSFERLQFLGYVLSEKLVHLPHLHTAYITINADELKRFNVKTGDTEGVVNYALSISGVKFAALIVDRTVMVKMSFRSKGSIPANKFAAENFNGGGHLNAAGGASEESLEATVHKFLDKLELFKHEILNG